MSMAYLACVKTSSVNCKPTMHQIRLRSIISQWRRHVVMKCQASAINTFFLVFSQSSSSLQGVIAIRAARWMAQMTQFVGKGCTCLSIVDTVDFKIRRFPALIIQTGRPFFTLTSLHNQKSPTWEDRAWQVLIVYLPHETLNEEIS